MEIFKKVIIFLFALLLIGCTQNIEDLTKSSIDSSSSEKDSIWDNAMALELSELADEENIDESEASKSVFTTNISYTKIGYYSVLKTEREGVRRDAVKLNGRLDSLEPNIRTRADGTIVYINPEGSIETSDDVTGLIFYGDILENTNEVMKGTDNDDIFYVKSGQNWVNGYEGHDVLYIEGARDDYTIRNWGGVHLTIAKDSGVFNDSDYELSYEDLEVTRTTDIEVIYFADGETYEVRYYEEIEPDVYAWTFEELYFSDPSVYDGTLAPWQNPDAYKQYILLGTDTDGLNWFRCWYGDDILFGGRGMDSILSGAGKDILYGNKGDDTFLLSISGDKFVHGGTGDDTLILNNKYSDYADFENGIEISKENNKVVAHFRTTNQHVISVSCENFKFLGDRADIGDEWENRIYGIVDNNDGTYSFELK